MKSFEANATSLSQEDNESQEKGSASSEEDGEEQDQLYALLTQSKQPPTKPGKDKGTKPLPGNVNRLLSKAMSRK